MHVLVTGGAGFIGANLVARLLDDPRVDAVTVLDDLSTGDRANVPPQVRFVEGSILDEWALARACDGVDRIVHLAARASVPRSIELPVASHEANATGTLRVLEAARRAGGIQVVVASSSSVYGADPTLPKREDARPDPISPYAVSKLATETYALAYQRCYDLPTLVFRFFNVFGPLQPAEHAYAAAIPTFLAAAVAGRPVPVHGDGGQTRDFTYVGSVVEVLLDSLVREVTAPQPVNLAFGTRQSLLDVLDAVATLLGRPLDIAWQPPRTGDVRHSQADTTRLTALFPDVRAVPFADGLGATLGWYQERYGAVRAASA